MVEMVLRVPLNACPYCGGRRFVVFEGQINVYYTGNDGDIVDGYEDDYSAEGMCCTCKKVVKMLPTKTGFIPSSRLREIMFDYTPHALAIKEEEVKALPSPMEKR